MKRPGVLISTGLALVALVLGVTLRDWQTTMNLDEPQAPSGPSLVMEGVRARGFNKAGAPEYWLRALSANRYARPPQTLLAMPWLEMRDDEQHWVVHARHGRMDETTQRIVLEGRVRGRRLSGGPRLELATERLLYQPDDGEFVAPGPVRIRHENGRTRAGSLRGRVPERRLKLSDGVETRYDPPS